MERKICNKCNVEKSLNEYHKRKDSEDGFRNECKICTRNKINNYRKNNKKKVNEWNKQTYFRNKNKHLLTKKNYRIKNKEKEIERRKKYRENNKEKIKEYYEKNKLSISKKLLERHKYRYENDFMFKLKHIVRARMNIFFKSNTITKKNKTFEIIGCTPKELKEHIEKQFKDGMCWERMGKYIHIDHIIPLSSAKTEEEVIKLCHYTNLQPLWSFENLSKGNKI